MTDWDPGAHKPRTPTHVALVQNMGIAALGSAIMGLGATYGVLAYKFFSSTFSIGSQSGLMLTSFLVGVPMAIGFLVASLSARHQSAGLGSAGILSGLSVGLYVFAAGALLREGTICIVMALPLFLIAAGIGALVAWLFHLRGRGGPKAFSIALVAPLMLAPLESRLAPRSETIAITREIAIAASPAAIWSHINEPLDIEPRELKSGLAYKIGVPYPIEARTIQGRVGGKRSLKWERGVSFQETITEWEPNRRIAWIYEFSATSFPPGSLDDHIVIGGQYFDLVSTSYTLTPDAGAVTLKIDVAVRVTTNFNWYAGPWARFLVGDTAEAILNFYKVRAETTGSRV